MTPFIGCGEEFSKYKVEAEGHIVYPIDLICGTEGALCAKCSVLKLGIEKAIEVSINYYDSEIKAKLESLRDGKE